MHTNRVRFLESPRQGQLIVFEGPDRVGKSTLSKALVQSLTERGVGCIYLAYPGNDVGTIGKLIYDIHHQCGTFQLNPVTDASLQALHVAAHLDAIERRILPALNRGSWVVLDRFWWSTWVYGRSSGVNSSVLDAMIHVEKIQWNGIKPTIAFLVDRTDRTPHHVSSTSLRKSYRKLIEVERGKYPIALVQNDGTVDECIIDLLAALGVLHPTVWNNLDPRKSEAFAKRNQQLSLISPQNKSPTIVKGLSPAKPTKVYDSYWKYAAERQEMFFRKCSGQPAPWTTDPILARYKFTNTYRASDRVSQYLIRHVIYEGEQSTEEIFFRTILFKLFNKIETWEMLKSGIGTPRFSHYSFFRYDQLLTQAFSAKRRIYSAAYMMPSGKTTFGHKRKHRNHLLLLERMMADGVPQRLAVVSSMRQAFEVLLSYPTIGSFLAYQFVTDLNYSTMMDFSEMDFVMAGPGAIDGIHKCFSDLGGLNEAEIIKVICHRQELEFNRRGLKFRTLGGRFLQLIDCQNIFCEVSKYARMKHPEVRGVNNRKRIKQIYREAKDPIKYWYPPKWGINHFIGDFGSSE